MICDLKDILAAWAVLLCCKNVWYGALHSYDTFARNLIILHNPCIYSNAQCTQCAQYELKDWLDSLSLSSKYDCFVSEGITQVDDLLLFKSAIPSIHLKDLDILKTNCHLNTLQLVKLKRNIELLDPKISSTVETSPKSGIYTLHNFDCAYVKKNTSYDSYLVV